MQVDGGDGCVTPTTATVQDNSYTPLSRPLFIYPSDKLLARPEGLAFVKFYVDNSDDIATKALFVPMTAEQKAESVAEIDKLSAVDDHHLTSRGHVHRRSRPATARPRTAHRARFGARTAAAGASANAIIVGFFAACAFISIATTIGIVAVADPADRRVLPRRQPRQVLHRQPSGRRCSRRRASACFRSSPERSSPPLCALVVCLPFGLGAAIYLSEYARPRTRKTIKPILEVLAGRADRGLRLLRGQVREPVRAGPVAVRPEARACSTRCRPGSSWAS